MSETYAVELKGLCKRYPGFELKDFNLSLPSGCIMGLIGENGAGKSTVIRMMLGAGIPDRGDIDILGTKVEHGEVKVKEDVGIVISGSDFPDSMTPVQINQIMKHIYKQWEEATFFDLLERFRLPAKKTVKDMSKGMKMKAALAVALSHKAKLLILDEATSGLDPVFRDEILDVFLDFTREEGHSILISSHILSDLEKICDYIAFLHKGKLIFCEEKDLIMEEYGICLCPKEKVQELDQEAIVGKRENPYGTELLVKRDMVSGAFEVQKASIEDVMLFMIRGSKKKG